MLTKKHYIFLILILVLLFGAVFANRFYKETFDNSIPNTPTQMAKTNLPELNDNFDSSKLSLDYYFNWGIPNKANAAVFFDSGIKEYTFVADIKLENHKWWQPSKKKFIFSDTKIENAIADGNNAINAYGYNIEYSNSKDFLDFVMYVEKNK